MTRSPVSLSKRLIRRTLTTTLTAATLVCAAHTGPAATILSAFTAHSCYTDVREDGSAGHWCQTGSTLTQDAEMPAGTFDADGQTHTCGGDYGYADPICATAGHLHTDDAASAER